MSKTVETEVPVTREMFLARVKDILTRTGAEDAELLMRVLELRMKSPFDLACGAGAQYGCVRPLGHGGRCEWQ